jgi:FkbM family methyltransferase
MLSRLAGPFRQFYLPLKAKPLAKPGFAQMFAQHITSQDVVIEVGAYHGGSTLELSKLAKYVYSFEPSPVNFKVLRHVTKGLANVSIYPLALGRQVGVARLRVPSKYSSVATGIVSSEGKQDIQVATLDSIVWQIKPTVLILDCEGSEAEVLDGGTDTARMLRLVLSETWTETQGKLKSKVTSLGFTKLQSLKVNKWDWLVAERQ